MFSSLSGAIYSPYDNLKMFLARSIIFIEPLGKIIPTSPEDSHPSSVKHSLVFSSFLK
jgi:hypothetical protein